MCCNDNNEMHKYIDNCYNYGLYFNLKKISPDLDVYKRFVGDLGYYLEVNQNNCIQVFSPHRFEYFLDDYSTYQKIIYNDIDKAIEYIEHLLNDKKYVFIRTIQELVPFLKWFDSSYNLNEIENYDKFHRFLIIEEKGAYYKIIDHMDNVVRHRCENIMQDNIVACVKKDELYTSLSILSDIIYFDINVEKLKQNILNIISVVNEILKRSLEIYYKPITLKENKFWGRNALLKLINVCNMNTVKMVTDIKENPRIVVGLINIIKRRELLLRTIISTPELYFKYKNLINLFEEDIREITRVKNRILKYIYEGNIFFDEYISKLLNSVLYYEDKLHVGLSGYF